MADNCGSAGDCVCGCKLNKFISCLAGKGHCGRHGHGCHANCTGPKPEPKKGKR